MEINFTSLGLASSDAVAREALQGYTATNRNATGARKRRILEAARLYGDALQGKIDPFLVRQAMKPTFEPAVAWLAERYPGLYGDPGGRMLGLRESMAVSDYQALFTDVLDRMYYGYYNAYPIPNRGIVKQHTLRDFRLVSRYLLDGMVTPFTSMDPAAPPQQRALTGPVPQDGATADVATTAPIQYQPLLWQAMASINWAAFVNDDLGIFKDVANRLSIAGNRGIHKYITSLHFDANGPNAALYKAGYRNLVTTAYGASVNNPPLSAQGLMDALKIMAGMVDSGGDPILLNGRLKLVHGPSTVAVAANLKNALSVWVQTEGGTASSTAGGFPNQMLNVNNWVMQNMDIVMDPYIPIVCTGKPNSWLLVADPESQERPCVELGTLKGFETPQLFQKLPNTQRLGGAVDQMMGDFYTLNQDIKIMSVFAGKQIDGRTCVGSNGSGS